MSETAYDRAVALFERMIDAPHIGNFTTPAALIQAAKLSPSTGYRYTATLEAEGFFRRDSTGAYLPGQSAIRTGLSGFGMGHFAPIVQPVLAQLRLETRQTAFIAIVQDMDLHIGPHSLGKEVRREELACKYQFDAVPQFDLGKVCEIGLRAFQGDVSRRIGALLCPVSLTDSRITVLGIALPSSRPGYDQMEQLLEHSAKQMIQAAEPSK